MFAVVSVEPTAGSKKAENVVNGMADTGGPERNKNIKESSARTSRTYNGHILSIPILCSLIFPEDVNITFLRNVRKYLIRLRSVTSSLTN
jgi:hypothetical protein